MKKISTNSEQKKHRDRVRKHLNKYLLQAVVEHQHHLEDMRNDLKNCINHVIEVVLSYDNISSVENYKSFCKCCKRVAE
jgi:hypothetical protein